MARPISDETAHKVTLHINNGYRYATLRPRVTNEATGKRMNKSIHLGTVTESLKFIPGKVYLYMSPAERKKLVLPLFSLVGPIFVGPKYKKKPNSVYIFVFTTNQIYSTWN